VKIRLPGFFFVRLAKALKRAKQLQCYAVLFNFHIEKTEIGGMWIVGFFGFCLCHCVEPYPADCGGLICKSSIGAIGYEFFRQHGAFAFYLHLQYRIFGQREVCRVRAKHRCASIEYVSISEK
jgi:hypothetical protein